MILRARLVLPMRGPVIEDGAVFVSGERIIAVGKWSELKRTAGGSVEDLGEVILLPGLINAHCHLDYTDMAGKISPPRSFADWIKAMVALKAEWSYTDFAQSWVRGAQMLLRSGTTTVADVECVPELLPEMWHATPLRVISFRELINLKAQPPAKEVVADAIRGWSALPEAGGRLGLSPHAPYTTTAELLSIAAHEARKRKWLLTTHVAESEQEFEMFMYRHGALYDWLKHQRDMSDCGKGSPIRHLESADYLSPNLLAVHVNYLWRDDAMILARHGVSVVHCPRSHAYFRHLLFPRRELAEAGVNVCLGTDSLASTLKVGRRLPELSMFAEMQSLAAQEPELNAVAILEMATLNAARALGREGELGVLREGARADLIAVRFTGGSEGAADRVVHHYGAVHKAMIGGRWVSTA